MLPANHLYRMPVTLKVSVFQANIWFKPFYNKIFIEYESFTLVLVLDNDSRYLSAEEQTRELTRSITREVGKLSEQWNHLIDHSDNWKHSLDEFMTVSSALNVWIVKVFDFNTCTGWYCKLKISIAIFLRLCAHFMRWF